MGTCSVNFGLSGLVTEPRSFSGCGQWGRLLPLVAWSWFCRRNRQTIVKRLSTKARAKADTGFNRAIIGTRFLSPRYRDENKLYIGYCMTLITSDDLDTVCTSA